MILFSYLAQVITSGEVDLPKSDVSSLTIDSALRIAFSVAGGIAVLIITLSAFKYVISQGDPQATAKAKNGIISAVIGLLICIMAVGIVTYVLPRL